VISLNSTTKEFFFYSDTHFGHSNILKYDNRPFENIKVHDTILIENWNDIVRNDVIFFLGDFALTSPYYAESIMDRLSGEKYFIKGNHDNHQIIKLYKKYGTFLGQQEDIVINGQRIVLNHFAMLSWNQQHRGAWQLHGHSHGNLRYPIEMRQLDVGCNIWNYTPIKFKRIENIMDQRAYVALDHHGE
jgi:calcineurin-like phosphoesterase family protein